MAQKKKYQQNLIFINLLLVFLFSLAACAKKPSQDNLADKIFLGGNIITVDENNPEAQAIAVYKGKILAVGSEAEVLKFKGSQTEIIDLQGNTLMPGLIDAHTHPILSSMMGQVVDISGFSHDSPAEVMESLKRGIEDAKKGEWVIAYGWDPAILRDLKAPTIQELDQLAPDNPLLILTQTLHTAFVNSKAFEEAGVTKDTPNPQGGYFEKDENGEFTGTIIEVTAISKFKEATPKFPDSAYLYLLVGQLETYSKAGYTTIIAPGVQAIIPNHIQSFQEVSEYEGAPVRSFTYPPHEFMDDTPYLPNQGNDRFKVLGIKIWIDGSPYAGSMAMNEPYLDTDLTREGLGITSGERGHLNYDDETLFSLIEKYHRQGWQIAAHTQGERAVDQFLNAVEYAQEKFPRQDHRHRMEHNALITAEQLERATKLGVTTSFYIEHVSYYGDALYEDIVGPERASRFMPMNTAINAGQLASMHTDSPSSPIDVFHAMQTAVLRKTQSGYILGPDERISVDDAIKAVTFNAAWQIFEEDTRGSLEVGKLADFTIISQNIREIPPEEWTEIEIVATYLAGNEIIYKKVTAPKIKLIAQTVFGMATEYLQSNPLLFAGILGIIAIITLRIKKRHNRRSR